MPHTTIDITPPVTEVKAAPVPKPLPIGKPDAPTEADDARRRFETDKPVSPDPASLAPKGHRLETTQEWLDGQESRDFAESVRKSGVKGS